jgi:hypothetical protein
LEEADRVVMQYHWSHVGHYFLFWNCQGNFSFNFSVFFVSFTGNNEGDFEDCHAMYPANDLSRK